MKNIKSALIDEVMNFETTEDLDIYLRNKGYERRDGDGFFEYGIPNQPAELRVTEDDGGFIIDMKALKNSHRPVKSAVDFAWLDRIPDGTKLFIYSKDNEARDKRYFPVGEDWGQVDRILYARMFDKNGIRKALEAIEPQLPEGIFIQVRDSNGKVYHTYPGNVNSSCRPVKSARYLVEDENGEVIAEADTYEEAQGVGGASIIDTQKEIQSSRKSKKKKWKHPDEVAKDNGADITCARKPSNLSREELVARICEKEDDNYSDWSTYELEQYAREIGVDLDEDITSSRTFPVEIVKSILSGKLTEEKALREITSRCRCNRGYAEKILSGWEEEYTDEILESGVEDVSEELNKDFDMDGNLDSWTRDFVSSSGHSATVGGEMVKAARTVIYMWRNSGDKIGSGDGTVNPAARYLVNASDFRGNTEIEALLNNAFFYDDEEYENWVNDFEDDFADYLRDNSYLFQKPNNDDILNYVEDETGDSINVCFVEDANGVEYEFCRTADDEWQCSGINGTNFVFKCDDVIDEKNEFGKDIDRTVEYGEIVDGDSVYSWEACDELDENGLYHCWKVTDIRLMNGLYEIGDYVTAEELMRYTEQFTDNRLYDENGNEITDSNSYQLLASSAVTSGVIGEGKYGIEINLNGWKIISKNGKPDGSEPAEFRTRNEALNSRIYQYLVERYGEDKVRVFRQD